jgi:hypothetical protein
MGRVNGRGIARVTVENLISFASRQPFLPETTV